MMYLKYLWYVVRHKWYVMLECFKVGLIWRGLVHDMSKFLPDEFIAYARYFYGPKETGVLDCPAGGKDVPVVMWPEGVKAAFDLAWFKHQRRNVHHWEYWIHIDKWCEKIEVIEMPRKHVLEMVCDWKGAGKAQGKKGKDECKKWYLEKRDLMTFHPSTRDLVESILGIEEES